MRLTFIAILAILSGCANYRPLIDNQGVDLNQYERDLQSCQQYAEQVSPGTHALVGAALGAGLSAILATVAGGGYDRGASTRVGAVLGAASGAGHGAEAQVDIIRRCLSGRGYQVLQ